ncbi:F-box protein At2g26850 [Beta vulgaris subsp. vulgaris]|uniref:F-box protein At2g26850 n=1 Tax=Beta vulgaris subsp. vulgaris TaxID=3555 RepID=UPI0020374E36|nr:F-box protein At2g26850 [Beta vulgaris subsp. vulgaris]
MILIPASPMLLFLISCFSFIVVFKSFLPIKLTKMKLLSPFFWVELCKSLMCYIRKSGLIFGVFEATFFRPVMKISTVSEFVNVEDEGILLLELPDLALDLILDRLSPAELCSMAGVCSYLRGKCRSNHMWEKHMKNKWGRVIGNAALVKWHEHKHKPQNKRKFSLRGNKNGGIIFSLWPFSLMVRPKLGGTSLIKGSLPPDSIMSWYLSLESGEFWFPAQVYNRENGHDGFVLSCYDAKLSYNSKSDTFQARYTVHGRETVEENISWSRIRAPPIDNSPYDLHVSDSLDDLKPGDHFEIQWRRNRGFPYGWWYGVVDHLESCTRNEDHCICHDNEMVILEFNQYATNSRWRRMSVNRKNHREEGNEGDGFYGGIRKIYCEEEISTWKSLWPTKVLN